VRDILENHGHTQHMAMSETRRLIDSASNRKIRMGSVLQDSKRKHA